MDGHEATRTLRAHGFRGLIIGVTGDALDSDVAAFVAQGANAVVTKPVNVSELLDIVNSHIEVLMHREGLSAGEPGGEGGSPGPSSDAAVATPHSE